jgi:hypothetical protein
MRPGGPQHVDCPLYLLRNVRVRERAVDDDSAVGAHDGGNVEAVRRVEGTSIRGEMCAASARTMMGTPGCSASYRARLPQRRPPS